MAAPGGPGAGKVLRNRVFATGGDAWASNAFIDQLSNRRMLVNALAWLTEQDQLVAATSRPAEDRPLPLTAERRTRILVLSVGAVPGGIIGIGLAGSFARRRRRSRA